MGFTERYKKLSQQETSAERRQRMLPGAIYGLIIASSYTIVAIFINQLSFPDLPVSVDWRYSFTAWFFLSLWLGLGGGFINWFTQTEEGMVISLFIMTFFALGATTLTLEGNLPTQFGKILLLVLPVLAISLLMTITLRWLGVRHAAIAVKEKTIKPTSIAIPVVIALAIGGVTSLGLNRWTLTTQNAVRDIQLRLETAASDPARAETLFPLTDLPLLSSHLGTPYKLRGRTSGQSVAAIEVTVDFTDGYKITCIFLVFSDDGTFLRDCAEGDKVTLPSNQ
jgi:hypothetical protein